MLALAAATLSLPGIPRTDLYPGIIAFWIIAVIALRSKFCARRIENRSQAFRRNDYRIFTIIDFLLVLVILGMAFVILHDRVLKDCC